MFVIVDSFVLSLLKSLYLSLSPCGCVGVLLVTESMFVSVSGFVVVCFIVESVCPLLAPLQWLWSLFLWFSAAVIMGF